MDREIIKNEIVCFLKPMGFKNIPNKNEKITLRAKTFWPDEFLFIDIYNYHISLYTKRKNKITYDIRKCIYRDENDAKMIICLSFSANHVLGEKIPDEFNVNKIF